MRTSILISIFVFLTLSSCDNSRMQDKQDIATPEALEDKSSATEIIFKRGDNDLIENLYYELAYKTPALKELETQIDKLASSKTDSMDLFNKYHGKNQSYYSSANNHIDQIKDTVLRERIRTLIVGSMTKYNALVTDHNDIIKSIDNRRLSLNDLHQILKLSKTLPLIEKYQKDNLPSTKSLEGYSKQLDKTIRYADSLSKE